MGCGASRLEPGEDIPPGLLPFRRRLQELKRSRTEESRRRRRERKDSIVSTTELLRPEERDADDFETTEEEISRAVAEKVVSPETAVTEAVTEAPAPAPPAENGDEEGRRIGFARERGGAAEEEQFGSPSFRIYFADAVHEHVEPVQAQKEEKIIEEKGMIQSREDHNDYLCSGEESELKGLKKDKGRKFIALPKGNFLNVRGCYNMNSATLHSHENPRVLSEKAT